MNPMFTPKNHYKIYCVDEKPLYYIVDKILYHYLFPEEWATSHLPGSGPHDCENCTYHAHRCDIMIGYCMNCSYHKYHNERGQGFEFGTEMNPEDPNSAMNTYLKNANVDEIELSLETRDEHYYEDQYEEEERRSQRVVD